jgi:hypothetical protein
VNALEAGQTYSRIFLRGSEPVIVFGSKAEQALHVLGRWRPYGLARTERLSEFAKKPVDVGRRREKQRDRR